MKKLFLFLFASLLSISMFAENDGSTKAKAVPYAWGEGIKVTSDAGVGKWYVVDLYGKFDPATGKSTAGNADANIVVANPLAEQATVDVTAYVGDNEMSRHFSLAPGEFKTMNIGAGFLVRSGIRYVYMFIVMDVTIPIEQAEKIEVVVEDAPANSTPFVPVDFDWTNFPAKTVANVIPANKETWVKLDFDNHGVDNGKTYKFYVEKDNATPITINAGISYDCPASSIQEQSQELKSASTAKILDEAKLSMIPGTVYIRIKAAQELRIYAEQVDIPQPEPGAQPIFNILNGNDGQPAIEVMLGQTYTLNANTRVYSVDYATLQAAENYYRQIEVTNNGTEEVTIVGKASKTPDSNGDVFSVATKTVTIPAGQTYVKKIDKTMQNVVGSAAGDKIYALGPEFPNVSFKLTEQPNDPEYCHDATAFDWNDWNDQSANSYKWYSVNIAAAKSAKADIVLTMETVDGSEANITVDVAAACALGEPSQSYSGKSTSTTKTLTYSLYKDKQSDEMYVRVRTDKNIKVKAELLTAIIYNEDVYSGWSNTTGPTATDPARVETDLTINNGQAIKALGLTLAGGKITIKDGGKLIIGTEGVKGSENVDQIIVEDGGILLIKDATSNNKPFVTAQKTLHFGASVSGARRAEKHEFIALPIDNREAMAGVWYATWNYATGWFSDGFNKSFVGYDVYAKSGDANFGDYTASFKGQLASNKNQSLVMPGYGWHAFGNSWLDAMDIDKVLAHVGNAEAALHVYVANPGTITGYGSVGMDGDEKLYIPLSSAIASATGMTKLAALQGFFLYTESATTATLKFADLDEFATSTPAPKRAANNNNMAAAVVRGGNQSDFTYMIEGEDANVHKMMSNGLALYAEDGLAQVANDNLIGTTLTLRTNNATEYTLNFTWLKGETMYLKDLVNGNIIAMTEDTQYTFNAEPNTTAERFQVVGRNNETTGMENSAVIDGVNKRIENGHVVIIKNGVKYNVLGAQL